MGQVQEGNKHGNDYRASTSKIAPRGPRNGRPVAARLSAAGSMFLLERSAIRLTNRAASGGLAAFDAAQNAGLSSVNCYRAGVEAWRRAHPGQRPEYAGKQAVAVILAAKVRLRVDDA